MKYAYLAAVFGSLLISLVFLSACNGQSTGQPADQPVSAPHSSPSDPLSLVPNFLSLPEFTHPHAPSVITRNLIEDSKRNIWIASYEGLIKYHNSDFINLTKEGALEAQRIFRVMEDRSGNIWLGTVGWGVYRYDGSSFTQFKQDDGLASNQVESIAEDDAGKIWFGTSAGVSCFDGKSFVNFSLGKGSLDNDCHDILQDHNGTIWVVSGGGVFYLQDQAFLPMLNENGYAYHNIRAIMEDRHENLWFGGNDGFFHIKGGQVIKKLNQFIGNLYEDRAGNLWLTASESNHPGKMNLYKYPKAQLGLPDAEAQLELIKSGPGLIFGMTEDQEGNIWVGTTEGTGLYDGHRFTYFKKP